MSASGKNALGAPTQRREYMLLAPAPSACLREDRRSRAIDKLINTALRQAVGKSST